VLRFVRRQLEPAIGRAQLSKPPRCSFGRRHLRWLSGTACGGLLTSREPCQRLQPYGRLESGFEPSVTLLSGRFALMDGALLGWPSIGSSCPVGREETDQAVGGEVWAASIYRVLQLFVELTAPAAQPG
jgi:hypothetical protein